MIFITKEVIRTKDLAEMLGVSKSTAYKIMAQIKAKSDRLGLSGMIHKSDYDRYFGTTQTTDNAVEQVVRD